MAKLKWVVEFEVDEQWIADGFNLTSERAKDMLASDLSHAYNHEIDAKVVSAPSDKKIATLQGYATVAQMKAAA